MIEKALLSDALNLADLHVSAINKSFIAQLGTGFLKSLYTFLIRNEIVLVERNDSKILGFITGSIRPDGMMIKFLILCPACLFKLAVKSLKNLTLFQSIIEIFKVPEKAKSSQSEAEKINLPDTELLSIAVHPEFQHRQTGTRLIQAFETHLLQLGIRKYKVIAVDSMKVANNFFLKSDFKLVSKVRVHDGILSNLYVKELEEPAHPGE